VDGCYTQADPIGLVGDNTTLYAYVHDLNSWIDEFGLDCHHIATNKLNQFAREYKYNIFL